MDCEVEVYIGENETKWEKAEFIGVFQYSEVIAPSLLQGGHTGGVVAFPRAVIKTEGMLQNVRIDKVRFND